MNNINNNYKNSLTQFQNIYKTKFIKFISLKHSLKKNKPNNLIENNNNNNNNKIKNILLNFTN